MIKFDRKDNTIYCYVSVAIPGTQTWTYHFSWTSNDVPNAQLLCNALDDALTEKLKQIREDAYNKGWKDAKAKLRKSDWFGGWW